MLKNSIDKSSWIRSGKDKTYFTNSSVNNILTILLQLICIDRQSCHIPMLNKLFRIIARGSIVKRAIGINAFFTVLKQSMPENIHWVIVVVIPDQWDFLSVILLKCIFPDRASIRALKVVSGCPATKVISSSTHFDFYLIKVNLYKP